CTDDEEDEDEDENDICRLHSSRVLGLFNAATYLRAYGNHIKTRSPELVYLLTAMACVEPHQGSIVTASASVIVVSDKIIN
ncbi:hypothetical protein M8C21_017930, partial [Ambrosia artemisiifolia]